MVYIDSYKFLLVTIFGTFKKEPTLTSETVNLYVILLN